MPVPEQWQLTLDVIKSKAQTLVVKNNGLQVEYRQLIGRSQDLQRSISEQQNKNEQMGRFLQERHGRTDQQLRIEELTQNIKVKKQQARAYDEQLENLKRKQSSQERKAKTQPQSDDQLVRLRKQLEDESKQEVLLGNELGALRSPQPQAGSYDQLKKKKEELEADIYAYESRMEELKRSSLVEPWPVKKKKLVHEMVLIDARNNQMRDKIKVLREDIDVLKDQAAKLERRVDFAQDKDSMQ